MACHELALLLLLFLPLCSAQSTYYVTPTPDTPCPGEPCRTLSEYVEGLDQYLASNTEFVFISGNHLLNNLIVAENVYNLTFTGDLSALPQITSSITCSRSPAAYFVFQNVSELHISGLAFDTCGGGVASAVSLTDISNSQISNCIFRNSSVGEENSGGGLSVSLCNDMVILDSTFENNSAHLGGGVYVTNSTVSFIGNLFMRNNASRVGGGMYHQFSTGYFAGNNFTYNNASSVGGGLAVLSSRMANFSGEMNFINNTATGFAGGLLIQFTVAEFSGDTNFELNSARISGGAMLVYNTNISFLGRVTFVNSSSDYGGALAAVTSFVDFVSVDFQNNEATYGAGIYARVSNLTTAREATFFNNSAGFGGGIYASNSNIHVMGIANFTRNSAIEGGGVLLSDGSTSYYFPGAEVYFIQNHATETGGAIKVEDTTPLIYCISDPDLRTAVTSDCFFQLRIDNLTSYTPSLFASLLSMTFVDNSADLGGSDVYGGILEGCHLQNLDTVVCPQAFCLFQSSVEIFDLVVSSTKSELTRIASEPLRICMCNNGTPNCNSSQISVQAFPGAILEISVIAFGQRNGSTAGVVRAELLQNKIHFQDLEYTQRVDSMCTNLRYTLLTAAQSTQEQVTLFAEGPCQNDGRSLVIEVDILPCPSGFQQSEQTCVCDRRFRGLTDVCNIDNQTILRPRGSQFWVGYDSDSQEVILQPHCPFDYCSFDENSITVNNSDIQCNYNRTGKLCGGCSDTTSLVLGSSRCMQCSNSYLALIIPFALAGIALVLFLFILKLTVADGTINGLIFYVNLVEVNSSIFYPSGTTNILTVFVSWINLDLGIETCFYDGMDAYAKTWLQFVFPIYLWIIVALIILISHFSPKITKLLGNNPIAVLATLFLLSYAKVLRTIIAAFSVTYIKYPNNSDVAVWSLDGNIEYLTGKHIPLFLIALLALLVLFLPYTLFLFLAQWIQILQGKLELEWRILSWLSKPSVKAFLDAYYAPYADKHRYWTGLLLLVRCVLYVVSGTATENSASLLSICTVITGLITLIALLKGGIYKTWYLGALEVSYLLNLVVLAAATYHVRDTRGDQAAATFTLLSIVFIQFVGIVVFHVYQQIRSMEFWKRMAKESVDITPGTAPSADSNQNPEIAMEEKLSPDSERVTTSFVELREPILEDTY